MPALPKPHRVAFLVPDVKIDGSDAAYEREAAVLLWTALIETCQRHPRLSVLDADATPLFPQDGHFAPQHAALGGRATDAFYGPTRRDEVLWLELAIGNKPRVVRLHAVGRDGKQESFDALGPKLGEQIQQVLGAWLTARGLTTLPRRFDAIGTDELLAVLRAIAPTLAEQARAWTLPTASGPTWSLSIVEDEDTVEPVEKPDPDDLDNVKDEDEEFEDAFAAAIDGTIDSTLDLAPAEAGVPERRRSLARPLVGRLPAMFKVPALRLLELALRDDLSDVILAIDPAHPQALFNRFEKAKDFGLLRQIIAAAPGWARPYEALHEEDDDEDDAKAPSD